MTGFEILINIQIICFLNPIFIDKYMQFLKKSFKNNKEIKLYEYLNSYWFINRGLKIFNYFDIIDNQSNGKNHDYLFILIILSNLFILKLSIIYIKVLLQLKASKFQLLIF